MIKALTPYYLNIPFVSPATGLTCESFTLKLYVWSGLKTDIPSEAAYEITIDNPEALTSTRKVNISNLINSSLEFNVQTLTGNTLNNGNNQQWIKQSVFYNTENTSEALTPQFEATNIFLKGYGYGLDGENPSTPTDKVLMQGREFKVSNNTNFTIPIQLDEPTYASSSITVTDVIDNADGTYTFTFSFIGDFDSFTLVFIGDTDSQLEVTTDVTSPQTYDLGFDIDLNSFYMQEYNSELGQLIISNTFFL